MSKQAKVNAQFEKLEKEYAEKQAKIEPIFEAADKEPKKRAPAKAKGKKKTVGSIPDVLAGKAEETTVKAEKSELTKRQITAYRAELKRKKDKIAALELLLDSHDKS